ncbi:MAG: DUF4179 domain-containing protein [Gorillibacterium sp.]|nr:DUF4179 domain-containing protein [Gorillibacterium sp.]
MSNVEKRLAEEKKHMESITAPEELEIRLRSALNTATPKRTKRIPQIWKIAAVLFIVLVISGNNYNAFAYYGKQLLGFDQLIHGTLKQLNDEGMGQSIEKKTKLEDGTDMMVNAIMSDANQLVVYYTLTNPNGIKDNTGAFFTPTRISGFLTNSNTVSGSTVINENQTEIKGMMTFDGVSPFSKELTLHFWQSLQNGHRKEGAISFSYNPNEALQTEIKQSIQKEFKFDKGTITFDSITATPTLTVINGTLHVEDLAKIGHGLGGMDVLGGIKLMANGTPIALIGSDIQLSHGTEFYNFSIRYDSLPKQLDSLDLVIKEFDGYQKLEEKLSLASVADEPFTLDGKELWVKSVSTTSQGVEIKIVTNEDVRPDGISIVTKSGTTPLKTTEHNQTKQADGRLMEELTLVFDTLTEPDYLLIEGMYYLKAYNEVIEIPIE